MSKYVDGPRTVGERRWFWQLQGEQGSLNGYLFDTGTRAHRWMAQGFARKWYTMGRVLVSFCEECGDWHKGVESDQDGFEAVNLDDRCGWYE